MPAPGACAGEADEVDARARREAVNRIACMYCHKRGNASVLLLCGSMGQDLKGCPNAAHTFCCGLDAVPDEEWWCPDCGKAAGAQAPGLALSPVEGPARAGRRAPPARTLEKALIPAPAGTACGICAATIGPARWLQCGSCNLVVHPTCLGLGPHAYPGGVFECAECVLFAARLEAGSVTEAAKEAARALVWFRGQRVQDSSQAAYASALHRWVTFYQEAFDAGPSHALPPGQGVGLHKAAIPLFISWAAPRYKVGTIRLTINALADWASSKDAPTAPLRARAVEHLLRRVEVTQGSAGQPRGKVGMSLDLLGFLFSYIGELRRARPAVANLLARDSAWLTLGFFGMMRRSELVALTMADVSVVQAGARGASSGHILVRVRRAKNDPLGQGHDVPISAVSARGWDLSFLVTRYISLRTQAGAKPTDPFLVGWDFRRNALTSSPLATGEALSKRLKELLRGLAKRRPDLGLDATGYAMHSLRRGGVQAAWAAGVEVNMIKAHGRWRSDTGMRPYLAATLDIQLQVTSRM